MASVVKASSDGTPLTRIPVDGGRAPDAVAATLPTVAPATLDPKNLLAGVFNPNVLHRVEITVADEHIPVLAGESRKLVPCTFSFDGVVLQNVGIRRKGFIGSSRPLNNKTGFSVNMNEFVKGQKIGGLGKILLNNAVQDPSYMSEHTAYEVYRMVGLPAPLTAHTLVTFNNKPYGLYVIKEAINKDFLARNFGQANSQGNLYEGTYPADPGDNARGLELKNEKEEMRSRADMDAFLKASKSTPDEGWETAMSKILDIPAFQKSYVIDAAIGNVDGYFFGPNNFYMYNNPATGKFVFIPHGLDRSFFDRGDPLRRPAGKVGQRVFGLPTLIQPVHAEINRLLLHGGIDVAALMKRMDAAVAMIEAQVGAPGLSASTISGMKDGVRSYKNAITNRRQVITPETRPGEGTGLRGEYFDNADLTTPIGNRIDPMVRFNWGQGSPMMGVGPETFSVRWTGFVQAEHTEMYEFAISSDDGVRLWIDGKPVINDWTKRGEKEVRGTIALEGGRKHEIKIEYFEQDFLASIYLYWSSPSRPKELVPTFRLFPGP